MFEAARLGDPIAHSGALAGFLAGAAIGIALVASVAFTTFTCGFGAALLAGVAAGAGASLLSSAGEAVGGLFSSASGTLTLGSTNVFINGRSAIFVEASIGACSKHPGVVQVAAGSPNVFINGKPAARKGDTLTCGATIAAGSSDVFIGGGGQRYLSVTDEVPAWMRDRADTLLTVAGGIGGLAGVFKQVTQAGLKAKLPCALKYLSGFIAGEVAAQYVAGPAIGRVIGGLHGNPVDTTTGRKLLPDEADFVLPGLMPIEWSRFYASDLSVNSILGHGWVLPWEQSLRRDGEFIYLSDNQGRSVPFVTLQPNQRIYNPNEQLYLVRSEGGHYLLQTLDDVFFYFGEVPDNNLAVPLQRIENALGHYLHFTRGVGDRLTDITASGGQRVHLHYDHPLGRLTEVKRIEGDIAVETLVQYRYDAAGQLLEVANRNGDTVRRFAYSDGVMARHDNALGLSCHYRWETLHGKPRVAEHWTSDGEHFHFNYDFASRVTYIRDVLGRQAQVHYNDEHRVVASTDFGGEHYAIDLDDRGNLTGLTLPDDNRIGLAYDGHSRLIEETDPLGRSTCYQYHFLSTRVTQITYPDGSQWRAEYDNKGNLIAEVDALGQRTEYLNSADGLPHTVIDANLKARYLWWNGLAQVERFQDCSGKCTAYRYNEHQHLRVVTDALGHSTVFQRQPGGEVLSIEHSDGSREAFTYNGLGQVMTHQDGNGRVTRLSRTARGLLTSRQHPNGQRVRYEYDPALRLIALINENDAAHRFAYDTSDRLIEEQRIDQLTRRFSYGRGGYLAQLTEIGRGEQGERPERSTEFQRDAIGRLLSKLNADSCQRYTYDDGDRLLIVQRIPTLAGKKLGLEEETLEFSYDLLGRLSSERTPQGESGYSYDPLGNLATLTLPGGHHLNHLYYGSGHLHQLNLDGQVISDIERDDLHREVYRTQGRLTSCFGYDALGRKAWQYASQLPADKLSQVQNPGIHPERYVAHRYNPLHRRYEYNPAGELSRSLDNLRGEVRYTYDACGQLLARETGRLIDSEAFRYDPAANRLSHNDRPREQVSDNRLRHWQDQAYCYDPWGNLIEKRSGIRQLQRFTYDSENRLVSARTWVNGALESTAHYRYDSLGRRVAKQVDSAGQIEHKRFLWQGLRLLREETPAGSSLYVYEPSGYAPLARIDQAEGQPRQIYYFHTDQIGTPLELTNRDGEIVWQASYRAWGAIDRPETNCLEQNLRFQGQYFDAETGLHYNTFRYYDPGVGRFTTQDPIGLLGGNNLYQYVPNPVGWVDPWGLTNCNIIQARNRREALAQAKDFASVPRLGRGGEKIPLERLNKSSRGQNWVKMKEGGARRLGMKKKDGKNEWFEHPDGHPDAGFIGVPDHHIGGHVHATNSDGMRKIFIW